MIIKQTDMKTINFRPNVFSYSKIKDAGKPGFWYDVSFNW